MLVSAVMSNGPNRGRELAMSGLGVAIISVLVASVRFYEMVRDAEQSSLRTLQFPGQMAQRAYEILKETIFVSFFEVPSGPALESGACGSTSDCSLGLFQNQIIGRDPAMFFSAARLTCPESLSG